MTSNSPRVTGHWDINNHKGNYAEGLVDALALAAGLDPGGPRKDIAIDRSIATPGPRGSKRDPRIDVQIKCWTPVGARPDDPVWRYPLARTAYDDLAGGGFQVPRYLVLCIVPSDPRYYVHVAPDEIRFRHAVYWHTLRDLVPSAPPRGPLQVPKVQRLTPATLTALVEGREEEAIIL